jgi:hypothetical protein
MTAGNDQSMPLGNREAVPQRNRASRFKPENWRSRAAEWAIVHRGSGAYARPERESKRRHGSDASQSLKGFGATGMGDMLADCD